MTAVVPEAREENTVPEAREENTVPPAGEDAFPGVEPPQVGLCMTHEEGRSIRASWGGAELFRYVYVPWDQQLESPRPYFHPLRTLGGDLVSLYRPHDHVWHKGLAWSLPNVGPANFWGGVSFVRDQGYRQLRNDGGMWHAGFDAVDLRGGVLRIDERLVWVTEQGETWIEEVRRIGATVLTPAGSGPGGVWTLAFETTMCNVSGRSLPIGSPTTEGRPNAGYGGLFWRGPRSFTSGRVVSHEGEGGDEYMGWRGPWLGFIGRHDGNGRESTLIFRDSPANFSFPSPWFVRSHPFACLCPAPFFSQERHVGNGDSLTLRYDVAVVDGALDGRGCAAIVDAMAAGDLLAAEPLTKGSAG